MVDSKENYNFDVGVKGLTNVIYLNIDKWLSDSCYSQDTTHIIISINNNSINNDLNDTRNRRPYHAYMSLSLTTQQNKFSFQNVKQLLQIPLYFTNYQPRE